MNFTFSKTNFYDFFYKTMSLPTHQFNNKSHVDHTPIHKQNHQYSDKTFDMPPLI